MTRTLDAESPIPIYFQLKTLLFEEIASGKYPEGTRLPTEHELCDRFDISRTPVHRALSELADDGVIVRRRRAGTFVNPTWRGTSNDASPIRIVVTEQKWQKSLAAASPADVPVDVAQLVELPDLHRTLTRMVGEGTAPDLALVDSVWVTEFAQAGFILPIDELAPAWTADLLNDLMPPFVEALSVDGAVYAIPEEGNVSGVWYRRDLLEHRGGSPPATWDELRETLDDAEAFERPLAFPAGSTARETTTYWLTSLLASNGVSVLDDEGVTLDRAGTVEAMRFIRDLVVSGRADRSLVRMEWGQAPLEIVRGRSAAAFGGSYEAPRLAAGLDVALEDLADQIVFAPFPAGPRGRPASTLGGMVYVLFRQSSHPEVAVRVLDHLMRPDMLEPRFEGQATIPPRRSTAHRHADRSEFVAGTLGLLEQATVRPQARHYHLVSRQLQTMLEAVVTGRLGPAAATERTAELISAVTGLPVVH